MSERIKNILEEIYKIDETMREHEEKLEKIINMFIKQKPYVKIDKVFVNNLRDKLMSSELLKTESQEKVNSEEKNKTFFSLPNFVFLGGGAMIMFLLMIPFLDFGTRQVDTTKNRQANVQDATKIADIGANAFGSLKGADQVAPSPTATMLNDAEDMKSGRVAGLGGGGAQNFASNESRDMAVSSKMIMPPSYTRYEYKYAGDDFELNQEEEKVFKRLDSKKSDYGLDNIASSLNLGLIDISKFENLKINSLNAVEDKDMGLGFSINAYDSSLSINQNWNRWERAEEKCETDACFRASRLKISDVPSDDKIIAIADKFVQDYGISLADYGAGEVNNNWREYYERSNDKDNYYIPENINVVYPLQVGGQDAMDYGGELTGLLVNVNIKHNKVANVYSLRENKFEASNYKTETDIARVLKIAEQGGNRYRYYGEDGEEVKVKTVEFGTPEKILLRYNHYNEKTKTHEELFIPALKFDIVKIPEDVEYFHQRHIIVPLVKDILDDYDRDLDRPIEPMPMLKGGIEPMMIDDVDLEDEVSIDHNKDGEGDEVE